MRLRSCSISLVGSADWSLVSEEDGEAVVFVGNIAMFSCTMNVVMSLYALLRSQKCRPCSLLIFFCVGLKVILVDDGSIAKCGRDGVLVAMISMCVPLGIDGGILG